MKAIVIGAGRVGHGIASELALEGESVTVIDRSPELIAQITAELDVRGVVGNGAHPEVLQRANAKEAELLIAVTYSDEVNMVACQVAHSLFDTPTKIARIRAQGYLDPAWSDLFSQKNMPIDVVISPEAEVGRAVLRRLETPGAFDTMSFADGRVRVIGLSLEKTSAALSTPIDQLRGLFPNLAANVLGVRRGERLFAPRPSDQLEAGDDVYIAVASEQVRNMLDLYKRIEERPRKVVIIGAGNIAVHIAQELEKSPQAGARVRIVEADKARAERAADALRRTVVLHGDGLDRAVLREAGVDEAELTLCLTNDDKVNVLAGALAKDEGSARVFALVNNRNFLSLKDSFGVDAFIDPRTTTVSSILRHVRKGRITGLQSIGDGEGEILEGVALDTSPLIGKPLRKAIPVDGVSIGAVVRGGQVIIPDPAFEVETGDRLLAFAEREHVGEVERMFRVAFEYF
jgi:trk system potassium uptake protein TrkA